MEEYIIYVPIILIVLLLIWVCWCSKEKFSNPKSSRAGTLKFIHIPKTGGSALVLWGLSNNQKWARKDPLIPKGCNTEDGNWHCPADYWQMEEDGKKLDYFCFIRDPVDRMISEANYENIKRRKAGVKELDKSNVNEWLKENITKYHNDFSKTAHFIPQYNYVYKSNGEQLCNNIIKYSSEMHNKVTKLFKNYNIIPRDSNEIVMKNKAMVGDGKLKIEDLNPNIINLIKEKYKKDYEILSDLIP